MDFNKARDDGVAVASAGPYANHLHLTPDRNHISVKTLNAIIICKKKQYQWKRNAEPMQEYTLSSEELM